MTQEHPVTPPPELVEPSNTQLCQLFDGLDHCFSKESQRDYLRQWIRDWTTDKVNRAAQWGADQELEACCEWLSVPCPSYGRELRNARRPKPQSLKEQALEQLKSLEVAFLVTHGGDAKTENIRRALEQLDD
jgi:hypothetical protein